MAEKLIKSKERVKKFAEVFTPAHIVNDMLNLLPEDAFLPDKTFLEPACGNGNFLVEILRRKLKYCKCDGECLEALSSIYAIDIQADNVEESKHRLFNIINEVCYNIEEIERILNHNIVCADSLKLMRGLETMEWDEALEAYHRGELTSPLDDKNKKKRRKK